MIALSSVRGWSLSVISNPFFFGPFYASPVPGEVAKKCPSRPLSGCARHFETKFAKDEHLSIHSILLEFGKCFK